MYVSMDANKFDIWEFLEPKFDIWEFVKLYKVYFVLQICNRRKAYLPHKIKMQILEDVHIGVSSLSTFCWRKCL